MNIIIKDCDIITGDGTTELENAWIGIAGDRIKTISRGAIPQEFLEDKNIRILDGASAYAIPGLINSHTHGCSTGPLFSSGAKALSFEQACQNAHRHLQQGVTSLINVCGLGTIDSTDMINRCQPVKIYTGTTHFPSTFAAAKIVDAAGITAECYNLTAREMIDQGAVLVGEIGSGATLGGGVSEYKYIPEAIKDKSGILLNPDQVHRLKTAFLDGGHFQSLMEEFQLSSRITADEIAAIIDYYTHRPIEISLQSYDEAFAFALENELPIVFHNAAVSAPKILELARKNAGRIPMIAAHCNHTSFSVEACTKWATRLKEEGVIIDLATVNTFAAGNQASIDNMTALLAAGLPDILTTDYGGGAWDGILVLIRYFHQSGILDFKKAIQMATSAVAEIFSGPFADTGLIAEGKTADIVMVNKTCLDQVAHVIIDGQIVPGGDKNS